MAAYDLVVRGGTVATASDVFEADIGVSGGAVVSIARSLPKGAREIDARGKLVLPGGIDSHVHVDQRPTHGGLTADNFLTGSTSAACGGNTTIIPFAAQHRGQSLRWAVEEYHARATGNSAVDYAFHLVISDPNEQTLGQELPALIADGYTSFKIFTTYEALKLSDRQILEVLSLARREGALVMVHAENADAIGFLTERLLQKGMTAPRYHAASRPPLVEREATHRAITFAELIDVPILIVHGSSAEAMRQIQEAQARGLRLYGETCPQYLFLTSDDLDKPDLEGAKCMCSPPPRDKANQEHIWRGLQTGVFQVYSSDHAPYRFDSSGKFAHGRDVGFNRISNGVPGVETRLPLLFSEGYLKGRISLNQFVALASTNAAKIYGLYPRKGTIAIGSDADFAIWDPNYEVTISNDLLHHNVDYTPYEGLQIRGWPAVTVSRGEVVAEYHTYKGRQGHGRFLPCDKSPLARPRGRLPAELAAEALGVDLF